MKLVLLGPPGAGKGTLAEGLRDDLGLVHISTGDILRKEMKDETELGTEAKQFVESGGLVPDELVIKLIKNKLVNDKDTDKGFLMDGFPRTQKQAEDLDEILEELDKSVDHVLCLEASLEIVIERLTGRRVCKSCGAIYHMTNKPSKTEKICDFCQGELYQRSDDNEETIKNRMNVYSQSTAPVIEYYKSNGRLKTINADNSSFEVKSDALKIVNEQTI
ncbi:MAG: adenylate kinase [Candidatus Zapsychrus exili]|nr:adenylate kinase [Candidatus Zapsychrus exili]